MNRVKIQIMGTNYTLATPGEESYVQQLAQELDEQVRQLVQEGNVAAYDALVLCAMSYSDRYHKAENNADHLRGQVTDYLADAARAREETQRLQREIEDLRSQMAAGQTAMDLPGDGEEE